MPRVSVLMPVYNGERFLALAVESILGQTFREFELIIVDDGSTDGSARILSRFDDPRIRRLRNDRNEGITQSLNRGLELASGDYVCRMDSDDVSVPTRIERQIGFMEEHTEIAVVGSFATVIDSTGTAVDTERYPQSASDIRKTLFVHNPFAHGAVMIRSSVLKECGAYDARFLHNEDYDLWLRVAARHPLANIPEPLLHRRVHGGNITAANETQLVKYRLKTLSHAFARYYRNPFYRIFLARPAAAYLYRRIKRLFA